MKTAVCHGLKFPIKVLLPTAFNACQPDAIFVQT
jgi:hypothetical protein